MLKERLELCENLEWILLLEPQVDMEAFTHVHLFEDELVALGLKYTGIDAPDDGKKRREEKKRENFECILLLESQVDRREEVAGGCE
jgi:hypothetical protein